MCRTLLKMPSSTELGRAQTEELNEIRKKLRDIMKNARDRIASGHDNGLSSDVLVSTGVQLLSKGSFVRSVLCYFTVATTPALSNTLSEISSCVYHMFQISKAMKKQLMSEVFQNLMDQIFSLVWEIIPHFGSILRSVSHDNKVDFEHGVSLYYVARMYNICEQYEEDAAINERAIKKLRKSCELSWFYACCHNNAGVAYTKLKNYEKARIFYERAIDSYKLVTNWTCVNKREDSIATTTRNLKRLEGIIKEE